MSDVVHTPILEAERFWECPSCGHRKMTTRAGIITPMHRCPKQMGLEVPLVQVLDGGSLKAGAVRHVVVERMDMIGPNEVVLLDGRGRPIQAVITERADGSNDVHVFAPLATLRTDER